jgi:hypothetical protein
MHPCTLELDSDPWLFGGAPAVPGHFQTESTAFSLSLQLTNNHVTRLCVHSNDGSFFMCPVGGIPLPN